MSGSRTTESNTQLRGILMMRQPTKEVSLLKHRQNKVDFMHVIKILFQCRLCRPQLIPSPLQYDFVVCKNCSFGFTFSLKAERKHFVGQEICVA